MLVIEVDAVRLQFLERPLDTTFNVRRLRVGRVIALFDIETAKLGGQEDFIATASSRKPLSNNVLT